MKIGLRNGLLYAALFAALAFALGCAINPDPGGFDACKVSKAAADVACAAGYSTRCTQAADAYEALGCGKYNRPAKPDPCAGKAPICERNDDTECWAATPDGKCTWFPKPVEPPKKCAATLCPSDKPLCRDTDDGPVCYAKPVEPPLPPGCAEPEEGSLIAGPACAPQLQKKVKAATDALGDPTGQDPQATLKRLAAEIRKDGTCAIAGIEAVFLKRSDGKWEEYHAVFFGNGGWTDSGNGKFIGCHHVEGDEPAAGACPAPVPPRLWTAETLPPGWGGDQIGQPRWKLNCKAHGPRLADCTPIFQDVWNGEACGYCLATMGEAARNRCTCPARPDGHPDRVACEAELTGGAFLLESRNGAQCEINPDNPFQFFLSGGNCRLCSVSTPKVCGDWL